MTNAVYLVFPLIFVAVLYVLVPLIRGKGDPALENPEQGASRELLAARRAEILQEIADLDQDLKVGRITAEDFASAREERTRVLAELLARSRSQGKA